MDEIEKFGSQRRWYHLHVLGLIGWIAGHVIGIAFGKFVFAIPAWLSLGFAAIAAFKADRTLIRPKGYSFIRRSIETDGFSLTPVLKAFLVLMLLVSLFCTGLVVYAIWNKMVPLW